MYLTPLTLVMCKMETNPLVVAVLCKTHADWMAWLDREYCTGDTLSANKTTLITTDGMKFLAFIWSQDPNQYRGYTLDSYQFADESAPEQLERMCATERGKALWEIVRISLCGPVPIPISVEVDREYSIERLGWMVKYSDGTERFEKDTYFLRPEYAEYRPEAYRMRYTNRMGRHEAQKRDRYIMDKMRKEANSGKGEQKTPNKRSKVRR